ncbi:MAG: glycosyltransferase family 4 protein [Limisphaerales bacterium]
MAYICADPGVPVFGRKGCSIHVQEMVRAMRALGVDVELFAVRRGGQAPSDLAGVVVHDLPVAPAEGRGARERALAGSNGVWRGCVARSGPFDAVYERQSLWSHAVLEWARETGVPALLEVNAPLVEEQVVHRGLDDEAGARLIVRRSMAAASGLLAVSDEVGAYLGGYQEALGKVAVVPNGVNAGRFARALTLRRQRRIAGRGGEVVIGFVGTLKPWHGTDLLLEAYRAWGGGRGGSGGMGRSRLLIVGDGPERERLETQAEASGLAGRVRFTGAVDAEDVPDWLGAMDIAVAPYPSLDGFYFSPLKVYEYMAAGLPVVASRIGQLERILTDGVTGVLVSPGDTREMASAIGCLASDPAYRERLGWAARAAVEARHTWLSVATRIVHWMKAAGVRTGGGTIGSSVVLEGVEA